jgi:DNA helicase-2/ATP-dependent DNA helicase PcrA
MPNTSVFSKLYKTLNPGQKKAVDTIDGPVIVIAGPGTGKTTILTLRIANILQKTDTAPENILALTFTESGAYVMRRKLLEIIGTLKKTMSTP